MFQDDDIVKTLRNYGECLEVHSGRPRGIREKLQHGRLCLDIRIFFFTVMMVKYWNLLRRAVVQSLLWRYSKLIWKWPQAP